jgi:hypothetical protein
VDPSNPILWLAWASFGSYMVWVLWKRYLPVVIQAPPPPKEPVTALPAWLFCEEGAPLDQRVQWFPLRAGGTTVIGARPRAATPETAYLYLTADDIQEDHARVLFNAESGRYEVEPVGTAPVLHNNEPLGGGQKGELADGDTLDLGRISRFRFTLTGPESS